MGLAVDAHHAFDVHGLVHENFSFRFWFLVGFCLGFRQILLPLVGGESIEAQGVGHHAEAGQRHSRRGQHGVQGDAHPHQGTRRNGNADDVVEKGPEEVFLDVLDHLPGQADGCGHVRQTGLQQDHVGGLQSHVGTGPDGNAHLGTGKGRGIVDAVAHHGNLPGFRQEADPLFLLVGQDLGDDLGDACLGGHSFGGGLLVAGEQDRGDLQFLQLCHSSGRFGPDGVRHGDEAQELAVGGKVQGGLALGGQGLSLVGPGLIQDTLLPEEAGLTTQDGSAIHHALDSVAGEGGEVRCHRQGQSFGLCQNGLGQGVFTLGLQRSRQGEEFCFRDPLCGDQVGDRGFPPGDRAGLVQDHGLDLAGGLQGGGRLEEDAVLGTHTAAHHDGHGGGQPQRAGAGDHQDADGTSNGIAEGLAQGQPDEAGGQSDDQDHRHEDAGDLVGQTGHGGLGGRGLLHQLDDPAQGGLLPHPQGTDGEGAALVQSGGGDRVPGTLVHGHGLTGQSGLVDSTLPGNHFPIHRDGLAGTDQHQITGANLLGWDLHRKAIL